LFLRWFSFLNFGEIGFVGLATTRCQRKSSVEEKLIKVDVYLENNCSM